MAATGVTGEGPADAASPATAPLAVELRGITKRFPGVTVVILSGQDDPETIRSALARGAKSFLAKQIDPRDLPAAIRQAAPNGSASPVTPNARRLA